MATIEYRNLTNTNLRDINDVNITDATAIATVFTGAPGSGMALGNAADEGQAVNIGGSVSGECDVIDTDDTATYVAFQLTNGDYSFHRKP